MRRISSTDDLVKKLKEDIQLKSKLIVAYEIPTPEFNKLVPDDYFVLEIKKFLLLKAVTKDTTTTPKLKPSRALDDLWIKFMTCIVEYHKFCSSVLSEDCEGKFIEKIGYNDERNPENGFEKAIEEYKKHYPEETLGTILWNPRYKDYTYENLLQQAQSSRGSVYHSPFYEIGHSYVDTFIATSPDTSAHEMANAVDKEAKANNSESRPKRVRTESKDTPSSAPSALQKKNLRLIGSKKCPRCSAAVGGKNHNKEVDVYEDINTKEEVIGRHRGPCFKIHKPPV